MTNAIDSVNNGADAFFAKPVNFKALLGKINELLRQQEQVQSFSEDLMVDFIETRVKQIMQADNSAQQH